MSSNKQKHQKQAFQTSLVLLALSAGSLAFAWVLSWPDTLPEAPASHGSAPMSMGVPMRYETTSPFHRLAARLERRLTNRGLSVPPINVLEHALEKRRKLLDREAVLMVGEDSPSSIPTSAILRLVEHPEWIAFESTTWSAEYHLSADAIQSALERGDVGAIPLLRTGTLVATERDAKNVLRGQVTEISQAGFAIDTVDTAAKLADAFVSDDNVVSVTGTHGDPVIIVEDDDGTKRTLTLLSTGMSDFDNSSANREHNVFKAFNERLQNVVIAPGEKFSLVEALDAPITTQKGWKEEKGLFGGGVALTPGAGICQSATTLYRAALLAGLPLISKKAHSLFVDHYEFFGIGLDATVFPGVQDLVFRNDTSDIIVVQTRLDGKTAYVNFYGHDDGRTASLDGPYFMNTQHRPSELRPLSLYQIGWVRTITYADGRTKSEPLISTYAKPLWRSLMAKYPEPEGMPLLTQKESTFHMQKIAAAAEAPAHAAAPAVPPVSADLTTN